MPNPERMVYSDLSLTPIMRFSNDTVEKELDRAEAEAKQAKDQKTLITIYQFRNNTLADPKKKLK